MHFLYRVCIICVSTIPFCFVMLLLWERESVLLHFLNSYHWYVKKLLVFICWLCDQHAKFSRLAVFSINQQIYILNYLVYLPIICTWCLFSALFSISNVYFLFYPLLYSHLHWLVLLELSGKQDSQHHCLISDFNENVFSIPQMSVLRKLPSIPMSPTMKQIWIDLLIW